MGTRSLRQVALTAALLVAATASADEVLYQSAELEGLGVQLGDVTSATISEFIFTGVRFELDQPVVTSAIGGHFVGSGDFFGALVALDGGNDVPDSGDLTTPDVLGVITTGFPGTSAEVYADFELSLPPGWYAMVFGSGLFGVTGTGGMPVSDELIGDPTYLSGQGGWFALPPDTAAGSFALLGVAIPEPHSWLSLSMLLTCLSVRRRSR